MFENQYVMDSKKYEKYMVPKFYLLPIFYIYMAILVVSIIGLIYFEKHDVGTRWKTVAVFLIFIAIFRGIFRKWMVANKQYRLLKQKAFGDKPWECRTVIGNHYIELFLNGKQNNTVGWDEIKEFREAKSYFNLSTGNGRDGVMLEKDSFTKGTAAEFIEYMKREHNSIPYRPEDAPFDR